VTRFGGILKNAVAVSELRNIQINRICRQMLDADAFVLGDLRYVFGDDVEQYHPQVENAVAIE